MKVISIKPLMGGAVEITYEQRFLLWKWTETVVGRDLRWIHPGSAESPGPFACFDLDRVYTGFTEGWLDSRGLPIPKGGREA